jgi:hypothetical protein
MAQSKADIITFKVDAALRAALQGIPNRSEFIRSALLAALDNACPLCRGTGVLTPEQKDHWERFAADHALTECGDCHAVYLVCSRKRSGGDAPPQST